MAETAKQTTDRQAYGVHLALAGLLVGTSAVAFFAVPELMPYTVSPQETPPPVASTTPSGTDEPNVNAIPVTHVPLPEHVRAIYMTACVAGTPSFRRDLVSLIEETELNAVVIDIKDYTGGISFPTDNPLLAHAVGVGCVARDMQTFINELHAKDIYIIGRITVFQDPHYTKLFPDQAVADAAASSTTPVPWEDYKGISFIDAASKQAWGYTVEIAKEAHGIGFDELNFDYIRYPSDGPMKTATYPLTGARTHASVIERFFEYLHNELQPAGAAATATPVISADLFGMTATNYDDLNIGQVLERAAPYFDFIAPMVYPSHYPPTFHGFADPNDYPYEVVHYSMSRAAARLAASTTPVFAFGEGPRIGTSTPAIYQKDAYPATVLRPWLQDFDYGGDYDVEEVRAQINAAYDAGLTSWMLWAPSNRYTRGALEPFYSREHGTSTAQ